MAGMRISGGVAGGRQVRGAVRKGVRPTASRVREALFSLVGQDLDGLRFLDAYGGSGIVALEAWSRGALVTAFERDRRTADVLRENVRALGATVEVRVGDALRLTREGSWDVVFADPPYAVEPEAVLVALAPCANVLVYEASAGRTLPEMAGPLTLSRERAYGDTRLWVYRRASVTGAG